MDNQTSGVVTSSIDQWLSWQVDVIEGQQGWLGWGWADGNKTRGLSSSGNHQNTSGTTKFTSLDGFLFIGDSITFGMQSIGKPSGVTFRGVSGSTADDWLNNKAVSYTGEQTYSTLPSNSNSIKALNVMLGTNQVNLGEDKAASDLKSLLEKLHKDYPDKVIFVQKILPMQGDAKESYNNKVKDICNQLSYAVFIDATKDVPLGSDSIHPKSPNGYEKLADNIEKEILKADVTTSSSRRQSEYQDPTMFKGSLDLEKTGLEKQALRDMILASYVTQATTDTVVGIEIPEEEMDEKYPELKESLYNYMLHATIPMASVYTDLAMLPSKLVFDISIGQFSYASGGSINDHNRWAYEKFGRYYFYIIETDEDTFKYYMAEEGIVKVLDGNGNEAICYSQERFNGWNEFFNESSNPEASMRTYESNIIYTVPEIGKIQVMTMNYDDGATFSSTVKEIDYAKETEISNALIPMELLVDFLDISSSSDFMGAFEELVKDQEIVIKVCEKKVVTEVSTDTEQNGEARANVTATGTFNPVGTASQSNTESITEEKTGDVDLGSVSIKSHQFSTHTSIDFEVMLEKANTWFMIAQRDVNQSSIKNENKEEITIPGLTTTYDDAETLGQSNVGILTSRLSYNNVASQLGLVTPSGYQPAGGNVVVNSSTVVLYEGTKTVTTTTYTNSYSKGTMKYKDNTDAFLGLWKNKDGKYHKYKPKYNNKGEVIGVADEACFDSKGKKVGYLDLYEDKSSYTGDLFVNADKMLFELLEMSENTQSHSYTMRYILYRYTGEDYGVTDFDTLLRLLGITTITISDYNVNTRSSSGSRLEIKDTDDGVSAEQHLKEGIESIANPSYKHYCMVYVDRGYTKKLIELQEKYGVNPAWIVAQSYFETQCGTTGSGRVNNWFGWDVYGGHTHPFPTPEDCFEEVCIELSERSLYFRAGNETIDTILDVWCPGHSEDYPATCKEIFHDILSGAGIRMDSFGGDFIEVARRCHEYVRENEYFYSSAINMAAGHFVADGPSIGSQIPKPVAGQPKGIDCSCYVSWVLREFKYPEIGPWQWGTAGMEERMAALGNGDWERHPASEAQGGDILWRAGHTEIYIGDGIAYNCGSTRAIRSETTPCNIYGFTSAWRYVGEPVNGSGNGEFLDAAKSVWKQICTSNPIYSVPASIPCTAGRVNCSSYVSWVLYQYGYREFGGAQHYTVDFYLTDWQSKYGWTQIKLSGGQNPINQLKPGDIIVRDSGNNNGHVTIVAEIKNGRIYCYDCGSSSNWAGNTNAVAKDKTYMLTDGRTGKVIRVTPPK